MDDINELKHIFSKYINGEYNEIGKQYSGAVRASLKAYLSFLSDVDTQFNFGYMYYHVEGVEQDYAKAIKWYSKAAEQGVGKHIINEGLGYAVLEIIANTNNIDSTVINKAKELLKTVIN